MKEGGRRGRRLRGGGEGRGGEVNASVISHQSSK